MLPMSPIREWLMRYRQPGAPSAGGNAQALPMDQLVTGGNQPAMPMHPPMGGPMPAERVSTKPMLWTGGNQTPEPAMQWVTGGNQRPDPQRPQWARAGMRGGAFGRGPLMGMYGRTSWGWEP